MAHRVTLIPGDGVGPEVIEAARRVVEATGVAVEWEVQDAGAEAMAKYHTPLPEHLLESIRRNRVALKGPLTTPIAEGHRSLNVAIRQALDLYANLRPAKWLPGVPSPFEGVDLVVVRENTEDLYSGVEHEVIPNQAAEAIKIITRRASDRVVRFAFQYAQDHGRRKVTAVHKANILKLTDGLFLKVAREIAKDYPDIEFEDRLVDNMCMQLVHKPKLYDVLVMPNLYGDILSDLAAGLVGGLGMVPSANIGDHWAVFEPVHGSAPKYAGQDKVNPTAAILSAALMLRHLGEGEAAARIEKAVAMVIAQGKRVTYDLKPEADHPTAVGASEFCKAVVDILSSLD